MRRTLRWLHRWVGLTLGVALALGGLTGALLIVTKPIDRAFNAQLFRVPIRDDQTPLQPILVALRAKHPAADLVFRLPAEPGDALQVRVRTTPAMDVFFDPHTGARLGERGEHDTLFNLLFELHSNLLLGQTGKTLLFVLAVAFVGLLASGLVLWWPRRWRGTLQVRLRQGPQRALFDLHRVGGVLSGLVLLVAVGSGAYMAYRPLSASINTLSGTRPPAIPVPPGNMAAVNLDQLLAHARRVLPEGRTTLVHVPSASTRPVRVRSRLPDEVHPNGLSSVWLSTAGEVLQVQRWHEAPGGSRAFQWMYPLHIGVLWGPFHQALMLSAGAILFALGLSGAWMWLGRIARDRCPVGGTTARCTIRATTRS